jgi:hypothetical protein
MNEIIEIKINILKKAKEFNIDEIHSYLKVIGFPTDSNYASYSSDEYLSQSISDIDDLLRLKELEKAFNIDSKNEIRIWKDGYYRLFISHRSEFKKEVSDLKEALREFGIDAFVAHEDIQVSVQWRDALVQAMKSMHCLLAYITDNFSENDWCSQEVGFACISGARIIPLRVGTKNPSGFLSFYQASNSSSLSLEDKVQEIISKVLESDYELFINSLLNCLDDEANYSKTKVILELLINNKIVLNKTHILRLIEISKTNDQVGGYFYAKKYLDRIKEISDYKDV